MCQGRKHTCRAAAVPSFGVEGSCVGSCRVTGAAVAAADEAGGEREGHLKVVGVSAPPASVMDHGG